MFISLGLFILFFFISYLDTPWSTLAQRNSVYLIALNKFIYRFLISNTARKTIFPKSWNIMKSSKIPRKYQLSINFLDKKKTVFPISEKFKTRTFWYSKNMVFYAEENIILHQLFESKEDRISHLQKPQNKNFSIFRKHSLPC